MKTQELIELLDKGFKVKVTFKEAIEKQETADAGMRGVIEGYKFLEGEGCIEFNVNLKDYYGYNKSIAKNVWNTKEARNLTWFESGNYPDNHNIKVYICYYDILTQTFVEEIDNFFEIDPIQLNDRMKYYEKTNDNYLNTNKPIVLRLDGKNFSSFTRNFKKPYDERLLKLMQDTALHLLDYVDSAIAVYHQSDEISLLIPPMDKEKIKWGGRINKMIFDYGEECTNYFNFHLKDSGLPLKDGFYFRKFDCRPFNVPDIKEGFQHFNWRQQDARRNSIQMMAQSLFSQKQLEKKNGKEMIEMCKEKGVNWYDYPEDFKLGTYWIKTREKRKFTIDEIDKLPLKHEARKKPDLMVERNVIKKVSVDEFWNKFAKQWIK